MMMITTRVTRVTTRPTRAARVMLVGLTSGAMRSKFGRKQLTLIIIGLGNSGKGARGRKAPRQPHGRIVHVGRDQ